MMLLAALVAALAFVACAVAYSINTYLYWRFIAMDQPTTDVVAKFATAQKAYDDKIAAGVASGVAPVQAQLDAANAALDKANGTIAARDATIAENFAGVNKQADAMLVDSGAVAAPDAPPQQSQTAAGAFPSMAPAGA